MVKNNNKICGPQSRKEVPWKINHKKIQHVSLKVLDLLELLHKNGMVNRGRSLKAPQRNINKEGIVVYEVSSLLNDEKRIYYEEQTKNILRSFKKKLP
ncbi:hypothetical protein LCGC14_0986250 [marine sediment metagenome]|uniref:Uncharacterized protein n=1 Tax=marine sediment metagenome TaxID=412755 RepID=A0A0F9N760_9ZZZZ|nr:hypothetical protein [Candidatus Aminicenantes bacterium]HEB35127.1 hypothetical protein [Candidatus Aminicenantes bacterium]